jgi:hypothetical protein
MQRRGFDMLKMRSPSFTSPNNASPRPAFGMLDVMISRGTRELTWKGNAFPGASEPLVDVILIELRFEDRCRGCV